MIVDVNAVGQDAGTLGVDVESCEAFVALRDLVHTALVEGRSLSLFLLDRGLLDVQKRQQHEEELGGKWLPFFSFLLLVFASDCDPRCLSEVPYSETSRCEYACMSLLSTSTTGAYRRAPRDMALLCSRSLSLDSAVHFALNTFSR
jgi:hypothetical protein